MGVGESYKYKLWDWLDTLPEQELAEWEKLFPQPDFWQNLDDEEEVPLGPLSCLARCSP